jgi:hypothetical protein
MTDTPLALTVFHEDWWPNAAIKGDKDVADLRSRGHVVGRLSRGAGQAPDDPRTDGAISMASEFTRYSAVQRLVDMIPWYAKIAAKILLSRLPISYDLWRRANLFRHGAMDVPQHALEAVRSMIQAAGYGNRLDGLSILEVGPGDSLSTALIAHALGARRAVLVDAGAFATREMEPYRALADVLAAEGTPIEAARFVPNTDALLKAIGARYLTEGLASLQSLPPGSIDFAFSKAVLEHIRPAQFLPMMRALRVAMAPSGRSFHNIDLQDHLAYALNNLRFSDRVWESEFMAKSGFYTNRIGYTEMVSIFREAGFSVELLTVERFRRLPTPRGRVAERFCAL